MYIFKDYDNTIILQCDVQSENHFTKTSTPKRRLNNPRKWKRNIAKLVKNEGEMYINISGKVIGTKTLTLLYKKKLPS